QKLPQFKATPSDAGSIELTLPEGMSDVEAKALIEQATVFADIPAVVVINENTGTIVMGGNVKLGPAVIAHAGLNIRIETTNEVIQPNPLSLGTTQTQTNSAVNAVEDSTQVAVVPPGTTVADLARILQELRLSSTDINAILQMLKKQGALKARIKFGG
ncbi:MAG TPA: flagellar basal body P-ring protein FlgI, partial [Fimbriimonadaceae bacterium]|nr:flagellar basal body P-ring protein FlgI [Fimbriimonadaceae bacterium]